MKKLKVLQVAGNSKNPAYSGDEVADGKLAEFGFVGRDGRKYGIFVGAVPVDGKEFLIYYWEPRKEGFHGWFKLVRIDSGREITIDKGVACESHFHGGLQTLTFYGKGKKLVSWSFHCEEIKSR